MDREVYVFAYLPGALEATPAGVFTHDEENGVGRFQYGRHYPAREGALPVDPVSCPLAGPIAPTALHGGLYGAFRDAAPDYWGRLVLARRLETDPSALHEVELLLEGGASRVGNLDFRLGLDDEARDEAVPSLTELGALTAASDALQQGLPVDAVWIELLRQGTSIGGARPKCVLVDDDTMWLAKLPAREDTFDNARVEHATLRMAADAGIDAAETRLHELGDGRTALLVRRFDREAVQGGFARAGFVSALTVLELDDTDRVRWSYVTLAERLRRHALPSGTLAQLFRRMAFCVACRNTDDHPRNHGFLVGAEGLALSPAYDIVPQPARRGVSTDFSLAMTVGERGRAATLENLLSRCESFGLSHDEARGICREVGEVVAEWPTYFEAAGVVSEERTLFEASFARAVDLKCAAGA